jgi:hypothetical protein
VLVARSGTPRVEGGRDVPCACGHSTGAGAEVSVQAGEVGRLHLLEQHLRGSVFGPEDALGFTAVSAAFWPTVLLLELTYLVVP